MGTETAVRTLELAQRIGEIIGSPSPSDLPIQLGQMAKLLASLPAIQGSIVIAFDDEGQPLTAGACRLSLPRREGSELDLLFELRQQLDSTISSWEWVDVPSSLVDSGTESHTLALPVGNASSPAGMVLVSLTEPGEPAREALDILKGNASILAAAIRSSIRHEAWSRIEALQKLARRTFKTPEWSLEDLAGALAELFRADAATILLEEHNVLRLSASTDHDLGRGDDEVVYRPGEGLTGTVFATGKPVRLSNTKDVVEVERAIGKKRSGPLHPERDADGVFTGQFLGVPMLFGDKVVGVLRLSRKGGSTRFTLEDERALQLFADLLGAALAHSWTLLFNHSVFESVTDAIAVSRREFNEVDGAIPRITMANPGAASLLGRTQKEMEGMDAREVYAPGEYERIREALSQALFQARGKGEYGPVESRWKRSDGTVCPVVISFRFLTNRLVVPNTLYTIGLARDTSKSEQLAARHNRLLELLDAIEVAYFQADQNGITREPTAAESRITGYTQEQLEGLNREQLYPDPAQRHRLLERARKSQGPLVQVVQQMVREDGTRIWVEGDLRILRDFEGREIGLEGFYRDVTNRLRLQRFLNEETGRVLGDDELFDRLKRDAELHLDYMSSLGHQLQTPLGALIETLRNFETGILSQQRLMERLPYVIGQALVCSQLVRNLSYMDKILRGDPFHRERVSLTKLAIETKLDFLHLLHEKRIDIQVDNESLDRLLRVQGHQEMLRQVVVNLVDNAIKYSAPGSTIYIRGRKWPEGPAFEISNRGFSISDRDREKIFDRGFRTRQAHALVPHGTGLGLWLVRKILEAHDASIRCQQVIEGGQKRVVFRIVFSTTARRTA